MSGAGHSTIKTVDDTKMKKLKRKLDISVLVNDQHTVPVNVFILNNCPYDIILGQNFLYHFDIVSIDNKRD